MAKEIASQIKNISYEDALNDYKKLRDIDYVKINPNSCIGNKAIDYFFFHHRLATKGPKGISFLDFIENKQLTQKNYIIKTVEYHKKKNKKQTPNDTIKFLYHVFQLYYGSINNFKPMTAKYIYCKYKPNTILDFSAGWGGRLLSAMASNINYIGYDTNVSLVNAYNEMLKVYKTNGTAKIIFADSASVDYSNLMYNMVFTSPPYYKNKLLETYENMPEYKSKDDFLNNFLYPVVKKTYTYLQLGGAYILNIPIHMYNDLIPILGEANEKIPLKITHRIKMVEDNENLYKEYMYVWIKTTQKVF